MITEKTAFEHKVAVWEEFFSRAEEAGAAVDGVLGSHRVSDEVADAFYEEYDRIAYEVGFLSHHTLAEDGTCSTCGLVGPDSAWCEGAEVA